MTGGLFPNRSASISPGSRSSMIIDYFPFFNERELLELRIRLLQDHVDHFVISEANRTFTGHEKPFMARRLIQELGLPQDRITVIEMEVPPDLDLLLEKHDIISLQPEDRGDVISVMDNARDRAQRNGIMRILDQFDDDDWIIMSDCDEILNPAHLNFALHIAAGCPHKIIKLPLINLYGRADLRPYYRNGSPFVWRSAMSICRRSTVARSTPHRIRCEFALDQEIANPTIDGRIFDDFGWHFSWMGGSERVAIKSASYAHAHNQGHQQHARRGFVFEPGQALSWEPNSILMPYPHGQLPQLLFDLPHVKQFLLPD